MYFSQLPGPHWAGCWPPHWWEEPNCRLIFCLLSLIDWETGYLDAQPTSSAMRLTDWLTCRSTLPADGHSFSRVVTHGSAISTPPTSPSYFLIDWTDGQWSFQRISSESPFKKTIIRWSDLSHPWKRVAKPFIKFWVTLCLTLIYSSHKIWEQPCTTLKARTLPLPLAAERFGW